MHAEANHPEASSVLGRPHCRRGGRRGRNEVVRQRGRRRQAGAVPARGTLVVVGARERPQPALRRPQGPPGHRIVQGAAPRPQHQESPLLRVHLQEGRVAGEPVVSKVRRVISVDRPTRTPFNAAPPFYLLESQGTLLLIYRRGKSDGKKRKKKRSQGEAGSEMVTKFVVFVADFERSKWKRAGCNTELREAVPDDRVLFLGPWCSRSVAIPRDHRNKSYTDMGGNSIVFFSDVFFFDDDDTSARDYHRKRVPFYCSVYDIKTRQSQSLLQASLRPLKGFQAMWLFPPSEACIQH
uniref:KIB1-4 beta-propeller domain-containing protein n=1 Tax=Aegilops tauschii TaxID=37682 RepID=M8BCA8_AEGTA